jgi:integral membrane protein
MALVTPTSFRIFSYVEAASFLLLLFVAMPLKYLVGLPVAVSIVGPLHGAIFVAYLVFAGFAAAKFRWKVLTIVGSIIAAVLPFGPLVFHWVVDRAVSGPAAKTAQ